MDLPSLSVNVGTVIQVPTTCAWEVFPGRPVEIDVAGLRSLVRTAGRIRSAEDPRRRRECGPAGRGWPCVSELELIRLNLFARLGSDAHSNHTGASNPETSTTTNMPGARRAQR